MFQSSFEVSVDDPHAEAVLGVCAVYKVNDLVKVVGSGKEKGVYVCEGALRSSSGCMACYGCTDDVEHDGGILAPVEAKGSARRAAGDGLVGWRWTRLPRLQCLPIDIEGALDTIHSLLELGLEKRIAIRVHCVDHVHSRKPSVIPRQLGQSMPMANVMIPKLRFSSLLLQVVHYRTIKCKHHAVYRPAPALHVQNYLAHTSHARSRVDGTNLVAI